MLGVKLSDLRNEHRCRKTRMMGLSDGERISMIRSAIFIQYTRVMDRRTDGIGVAYTHYSIYAVVRKNQGLSRVNANNTSYQAFIHGVVLSDSSTTDIHSGSELQRIP